MSEVPLVMSDAVALREASELLRELARPAEPGESAKAALRRVHRRLRSWSFNRVRDVWYLDPRIRLHASELEQLRMAARKPIADKSAQAELRELQKRIARLEQILGTTDQDFHGESIAAARYHHGQVLRALGVRNRS